MSSSTQRSANEIAYGKKLAQMDPEQVWGWGTPAGQLRARRRADLIASSAGLKPGIRALEIGCGTGLFTEYFAKTGAEIVAVDISADLLDMARQRNLPSMVRFVHAPFEDVIVDGPFGAVIGSSILHHLEIEAALVKIHHLLRPGGVMCFAEPNMLNPHVLMLNNIPRRIKERLGISPDEKAFFRWQLFAWMQAANFVDIRIEPFDWLHPATPPNLIPLVQDIGRRLEKAPIVREISGSLFIFGRTPNTH